MDSQWMRQFEQEMDSALQERARLDERLGRLMEEFQAQKAKRLEDPRTSQEGDHGASKACFGPEIEVAPSFKEAYFLVSDLEKTVQELQKVTCEKDNDIEFLKTAVSALQDDLRHEAQASLGEAVQAISYDGESG